MTTRSSFALFAAAFFCFGAGSALGATNLAWNGDFESGTFVDPTTGDVLPNDWTIGPPSPVTLSKVNVVNTTGAPLGPQSGSDYLRYQSNSSNGSEDCIWQDIPTIAGQKYTFSYYVDDTSTSVGNNVEFHAVWDENKTSDTHTYNIAPVTGPTGYQLFTFTETASSTLTRIDFHAVDTNGSMLLDNVSVTALPEPAVISLVGPVFLLMGRRRRSIR